MAMEVKNRVLVIGALNSFGVYIVTESIKLGHPTAAFLPGLESIRNDEGELGRLYRHYKRIGVLIMEGDIHSHANLVQAVFAADVVISTLGHEQVPDQKNIIDAIKEVRNITRFIPSEFGTYVDDQTNELPEIQICLARYHDMRKLIELSGVPYTYIVTNLVARIFFEKPKNNASLPLKCALCGDGNTKVAFTVEDDVGKYTVLAAFDPKTVNKTVYIWSPENEMSLNEIVVLWEKKTKKQYRRKYLNEEKLLKRYHGQDQPKRKATLAFLHAVFVRGEQTKFVIQPSVDLVTSNIYPDIRYTTLDEYMNRLLTR